jgi:hypothetical protein
MRNSELEPRSTLIDLIVTGVAGLILERRASAFGFRTERTGWEPPPPGPIGLEYWNTASEAVFLDVGHNFVPILIQLPNYILVGGSGKRSISPLNAASHGASDREVLYCRCAARGRSRADRFQPHVINPACYPGVVVGFH